MSERKLTLLLQQLQTKYPNDTYVRENFRRIQDFIDKGEFGTGGGDEITNITNNFTTVNGIWEEVTDTVSASSSKVVDTVALADFSAIEYKVTLFNTANNKTKKFTLDVVYENSAVSDTLYAKRGSALNYGIAAAINGSNMEITVTNNEAYDLEVSLGRLIQ